MKDSLKGWFELLQIFPYLLGYGLRYSKKLDELERRPNTIPMTL